MIDPRNFARVKNLFDRLCDLSEDARRAALDESDDDAEVIAEVRRMLEKTAYPTARFGRPVLDALAQVTIFEPYPGDSIAGVSDLSADGNVLVGMSNSSGPNVQFHPYFWTRSGGRTNMTGLPGVPDRIGPHSAPEE